MSPPLQHEQTETAPFDEEAGYSVPIGTLTDGEREEFRNCEAILERGQRSFIEEGKALGVIREKRFYRETHTTFEVYCNERWGRTRGRVNQLIRASEVMANLDTLVSKPDSERLVRPLLTLSPDQQYEAWQRAVETAPDGKVTAAHVESIAREYRNPEPVRPWNNLTVTAYADRNINRLFEFCPVEFHPLIGVRLRVHADQHDNGSSVESYDVAIPLDLVVNRAIDRPFVYGSVCSGIEAATVAWQPLGWQAKWFAEVAPFPSAVIAHHYPTVPNLGDFTSIGEEHGPIDLLVGGTPCQSFSITGLRGGLADERGNLALEYLRLAQRLCPTWLVWENVPGILSSDGGRAFGAFLGGLEELGYGWAYRILDAQYFGVPQRRNRVFVVGHRGDWRIAAQALFERESLSEDPRTARRKQKEAASEIRRDDPSLFETGNDQRTETQGSDERPPIFGWNGDEEFKYARGISTTLRSSQGGEGNGFATDDVVRNYTCIERERMMGFPDSYTKVPYKNLSIEQCPDKPREHALGNSMAVPCMAWIGTRIDRIRSLISSC